MDIKIHQSRQARPMTASQQRTLAATGGQWGIRGHHEVLAEDIRFGDSERLVGLNGELNASSKRDLFSQQRRFLNAISAGNVITSSEANARQIEAKRNAQLVQAVFNDATAHKIVGERLATSLYATGTRQGFGRKYLCKVDATQGIVRFPVRGKNVTAFYYTSPVKIAHQKVEDRWLTPPELQIATRPYIHQNELNVSSGDILNEKFVEAQEAIMVTEDRLWYNAVQATVGQDNAQTVVTGNLTPATLSVVMNQVSRWGMKVPHLLLASDLYIDIIGGSEFYTALEPVARHELLMTGELATMYGASVTSDAYRHPEHKVIGRGEFYAISDDITHGAFNDRNGLITSPIDQATEGVPGRGWMISESFTLAVANSRSVAKGLRL